MLFRDFQETFIDVAISRKNSQGELQQKRMALANHLIPYFGDVSLDVIGMPEIRRYIKQKLTEGYAEKTVNNHLIVLSRYLSLARDERVLDTPRFKIEHIPLEYSEARFLTAKECRRLLTATLGEENLTVRNLVTIALNTGLRIGELLALNWKQVDLRSRKLTVAKSLCRVSGKLKAPKNNKQRAVSINIEAQAAFKSFPHREGPVFDITYSAAYDAINRIAARAGLEFVGWHTLRHTFASLLVMEGVPLFTVSTLLGHSSVRITERYAHLNDEKNKDAVACLALAMGA